MTGCGSLGCCVAWSNLLWAFNQGLKLEASIEAARRVREGESPSCKFRLRALKQMEEEGWLNRDHTEVRT